MKDKTKLLAALILAVGASVAVAQQEQTFTGTLTDSMCGTSHMAKDKTPAECTRMCAKDGMKYALAVDKKLYTLEGHEAELSKLAEGHGQGNREGRHDNCAVRGRCQVNLAALFQRISCYHASN